MTKGSKTTIEARAETSEVPWEALYETHAQDIARYLRRLVGNADTAADLMQETFVRAMHAARRPPREEMRPWLFRVASNLAMSHLRKPVWRSLLGIESQPKSQAPFEEAEQLRQAMRSIPPDQAVTLALAFHEGFSRREIAGILGVSEETVKSRIARGRLNFTASYKRLERGLRA